jgi:hypothetical protein
MTPLLSDFSPIAAAKRSLAISDALGVKDVYAPKRKQGESER